MREAQVQVKSWQGHYMTMAEPSLWGTKLLVKEKFRYTYQVFILEFLFLFFCCIHKQKVQKFPVCLTLKFHMVEESITNNIDNPKKYLSALPNLYLALKDNHVSLSSQKNS